MNSKIFSQILFLSSMLLTLSSGDESVVRQQKRIIPGAQIKRVSHLIKPSTGNTNSKYDSKLRTLVIQVRSDSGIPGLVLKRAPSPNHAIPVNQQSSFSRIIRPFNMIASPSNLILRSSPLISKYAFRKSKPAVTTTTTIKLNNIKQSGGEYTYDKPNSLQSIEIRKPEKQPIHLNQVQLEPIYTVPAPNLGVAPIPAHLSPENFIRPRPTSYALHTYQVTEPTNDLTLHDPFSGRQKYFAPDPDPTLPTHKIPPSVDPFSIPSNGKPLPIDIQNNYLQPSTNIGIVSTPLLVSSTMQQPYLTDYYGVMMNNQPQYYQYLSLQAANANKIPSSAYNPSYLITQSNNLFNQYQQKQLFKPNSHYLNGDDSTNDIHQVASSGQILQAAKDPANRIYPQYPGSQQSSSHKNPTFAALTAASQTISENSVENENLNPQGGFVVSNYYDNLNNNHPQSYSNLPQRQLQSELSQAELDLHNQVIAHTAQQYINVDSPSQDQQREEANAHEEHQKLLQQHLGPQPLRIFVPDDENQGLQKRSDTFLEDDTKLQSKEASNEIQEREMTSSSFSNENEHFRSDEDNIESAVTGDY